MDHRSAAPMLSELSFQAQLRVDAFGPVEVADGEVTEKGVVAGMLGMELVADAALVEVLLGVLADGLEQPEACLDAFGVSDDKRAPDETRQQLQHLVSTDEATGGHRLAASRLNPPTNTARRAKSTCSASLSRS